MKQIMVNDFPDMMKENHCEYSKGVIILMRLARRYEKRYKTFCEAEKNGDVDFSKQKEEAYGQMLNLMLFEALEVAQKEKKQGWKFVEAGKYFLQTVAINYFDNSDFRNSELIYRLRKLASLLITSKSLEYIQEATGFPEIKEVVEQ